jgi:DNA-directed RNA polymerase beta subunit
MAATTTTMSGTRVSGDDIIIGKTTPVSPNEEDTRAQRFSKKDSSISVRSSETGIIDKVMLSTNSDGYKFCKVLPSSSPPPPPSPNGRLDAKRINTSMRARSHHLISISALASFFY